MDKQVVAGFIKEVYESARQLERPGRPMLPWNELSVPMQEWWSLFALLIAEHAEAHVLATVPLASPAPRKMLNLLKGERIIPHHPQQAVKRR